ncbi:MAG: hypothetical protein U9O94_02555 [Nanoarchaeota archaeon]|nr:hypothetical protein [Nanoarchaeota archaeon]
MKRKEEKEDSAVQATNKMRYEKPKISYKTIRKNTNLDKFFVKKAIEEDEEESNPDKE